MKYGMKLFRYVLGGIALCLVAVSNAATINPGGSVTLSIGDSYTAASVVGSGSFSETYTFNATENLTSVSVAVGLPYGTSGVGDLALAWNGPGTGNSGTFTLTDGSWIFPLPVLFQGMSSGDVWTLTVAGSGLGTLSNYNLSISAVPLPPAVLGFGAVLAGAGFMSRRKKKSAAAQAVPA